MKNTKAFLLSLILVGVGLNCSQVAASDRFEMGCPCKDKKPGEPTSTPRPRD